VGSLTVDDPKIMSLFVAEEPRPIVAQTRLHVFFEYFFGLKEMTVTVDNHRSNLSAKSSRARSRYRIQSVSTFSTFVVIFNRKGCAHSCRALRHRFGLQSGRTGIRL